ncbi:hypothetical protein BS78_K194000 [Paspalum vaginatum]|uniref:Uncharacterized protein n=1 Tax=Paspalum vaginatum TaxID=158149 RepID=A0A9W7XEF7_9POAL|nr:hypothetical protein BS78_K194000 [Paspalum vaginatum]
MPLNEESPPKPDPKPHIDDGAAVEPIAQRGSSTPLRILNAKTIINRSPNPISSPAQILPRFCMDDETRILDVPSATFTSCQAKEEMERWLEQGRGIFNRVTPLLSADVSKLQKRIADLETLQVTSSIESTKKIEDLESALSEQKAFI